MIPAGESFDDHRVHESAWVTVIDGEVEITTSAGESVTGSTGLVVAFGPNERHAVHARSDTRLLLLLTPWPGIGHPGTMTLEQKANARHDAAEHRGNPRTRRNALVRTSHGGQPGWKGYRPKGRDAALDDPFVGIAEAPD